jgi:hypothetical protein
MCDIHFHINAFVFCIGCGIGKEVSLIKVERKQKWWTKNVGKMNAGENPMALIMVNILLHSALQSDEEDWKWDVGI